MSAFIVSKDHIDALVTAWIAYGDAEKRRARADAIGQMLWRENHLSVGHLYDGRHGAGDDTPEYHFKTVPVPANIKAAAVQVLKLIDCLEYQSCEHPGWRESEARKWCDRLRGAVIGAMPGYQGAAWEARDRRVLS